jgi:anthranilate synthase component 2
VIRNLQSAIALDAAAIPIYHFSIIVLYCESAMNVLLLDNYDSFTYNLYQYLCELGATVEVVRNDSISVAEVAQRRPDRIVISPGPCTPNEAGISVALIQELGPHIPLLGVCLGHQAIGQAYGGTVVRAHEVMHGKISQINHSDLGVFAGLPQPFPATRYHSLIVRRDDLPAELEVTAWTDDGLIMGLRHREFPVEGVQFHPESIMTDSGKQLLSNFLNAPGDAA